MCNIIRRALETKSTAISTTVVLISAAAWSWSSETLAQARRAVISAVAQPVMVTWDGSTPTATHGHPVVANDTLIVEGAHNIPRIRLIRQGGSDATATITLEL
ncbi:MAG: hypothetical protein ACYSYL_00250 [Planctomycetota bacterium]|jgi:hypothetical protein